MVGKNLMKNIIVTFFLTALLFIASNAFAFTVPSPTGFVTDASGKLSSSQVSQLNQRLSDYQVKTKNEIAVLLISSLDGENLEDATHQTFQTYKVGKAGLDNGVLLFIAVNDHKMRLQTGSGIGGEITDIEANNILNSMKPFFRNNNFYGGINIALNLIQVKLDNRTGQKVDPGMGQQFNQPVPQPTSKASCSVGEIGTEVGFSFGFMAFFLAVIAFTRRLIRQSEERKMAEIEARIDAEFAAERLAAQAERERHDREDARMLERQMDVVNRHDQAIKNNLVKLTRVKARSVAKPIPSQIADLNETSNRLEEEKKLAIKRREAEERARTARAAERKAEEDRRSEARKQKEEEPYSPPVWKSILDSSDSSDSGFGGGDSGGGGSSVSWDSGSDSGSSSGDGSGGSDW